MPIKNLQVPAPKLVGRQKKIIEPTSSEAPSEFPVPKKGRPKKPEETEEELPKPEPKRRGRPKKAEEEELPKPEPKRRGRPKKNTNELNEQVQPSQSESSESSENSEVDPEYLRKQLLIIEQIQKLQS